MVQANETRRVELRELTPEQLLTEYLNSIQPGSAARAPKILTDDVISRIQEITEIL